MCLLCGGGRVRERLGRAVFFCFFLYRYRGGGGVV